MEKNQLSHYLRLIGHKEGVVLIAVLWICALVMWFTLQIGAMTRLQGEEQVHLFRRSQAYYLAVGGCYETLARMGQPLPTGLERDSDLSWQPDGTRHMLKYRTGEALVSVESEKDKVNINTANPQQVSRVLGAAGIEENDAERLADVIADFIDTDDLARLHGMEESAYKRLGLPYGPFNGPLLSLDQMLLIPGITEQLLYGYMRTGDSGAENDAGATYNPMIPSKDSLFEMFTIYGTNALFHEKDLDEEIMGKVIPWENGGIYRIFSTGMAYSGPPAVTICLTVRFAPQMKQGYEVLSRKIL
jgi:hypothetical protein